MLAATQAGIVYAQDCRTISPEDGTMNVPSAGNGQATWTPAPTMFTACGTMNPTSLTSSNAAACLDIPSGGTLMRRFLLLQYMFPTYTMAHCQWICQVPAGRHVYFAG